MAKKKVTTVLSHQERKELVEPRQGKLSIGTQCNLVGISTSAYYYAPRFVSEGDILLMTLLDEEYTRHPFKGTRRLADHLKDLGHQVGRGKVRTLMKRMGITAIYPKPRLKPKNTEHRTYPYLLRNLDISRPDQVWCSDITYIRLNGGFAYLVAIMDWNTRYVLDWELSMSLDSHFCVSTLKRCLEKGRPEIFNTDQGCQFTSRGFTTCVIDAGVKMSMDGVGRAFDNIIIERLWRTVKYEDVYINDYSNYFDGRRHLEIYIRYYNEERKHSSLGNRTPSAAYHDGRDRLKGDGRVA